MPSEQRHGLKFEATINAGHILQVIGMLAAMSVMGIQFYANFSRMDERQKNQEARINLMETAITELAKGQTKLIAFQEIWIRQNAKNL